MRLTGSGTSRMSGSGICTTDRGASVRRRILTQNCVTQVCVTNSVRLRARTSGRLRNTRNATGTDPPQNPERLLIRCEAKREMLPRARGSGPGVPVALPPRGDNYVEAGPSTSGGVAPPVTSPPYGRTARACCDRARTVMRTRSQRDQALRDLGAARTLLRREGWLGHHLRKVAAAAASGRSASTISPTWRRAA